MARLRLEINIRTGKVERNLRATNRLNGTNFANTIVRDIGIRYADSRYRQIKSFIENEIRADVEREIENIARRYKSLIVGYSGRAREFTLTSALQGASRAAVREPIQRPSWPKLKPKYAAWKSAHGRSPNHFLNAGYLGNLMSRGSTWTNMFGPVEVRTIRTHTSVNAPTFATSPINALGQFPSRRGGTDIRFSVAKIEVRALGRITASMLPALTGEAPSFASSRNPGLMRLVYSAQSDPKLGYRISGNPKTTPYRSTIEPFLGFVLTRAIPAAVSNRVRSLIPNSGHENYGQGGIRFR